MLKEEIELPEFSSANTAFLWRANPGSSLSAVVRHSFQESRPGIVACGCIPLRVTSTASQNSVFTYHPELSDLMAGFRDR
jgi:hypothetical protein